MNKIFLQLWEISEINNDTMSDGCSIHIDMISHKKYLDKIYNKRNLIIPKIYERIVGDPIISFVDDNLYNIIKEKKSIRLFEYELNNLIDFEELIIKN